ncbi:MAG: DUF1614 domain-containing protein [Thermoplasmatota archaeon]
MAAVDLVSQFLVIFIAIALVLLIAYFVYATMYEAFEEVGFTKLQAAGLLIGMLILSGVDVPLPIPATNGWIVAVNLGGGVVPLVVSVWLLYRKPSLLTEALAGVMVVALVTYFTVSVDPTGIGADFPLFLVPPLVAAGFSLLTHWRSESFAAPLAFIAGSVGSLVGADILHLPDFLAQTPPSATENIVSIGGAGVFDMVVLSAIIAVALDMLYFHRIRHEFVPDQQDVFTTSTPAEAIRDWTPRTTAQATQMPTTPVQDLRAAVARREQGSNPPSVGGATPPPSQR